MDFGSLSSHFWAAVELGQRAVSVPYVSEVATAGGTWAFLRLASYFKHRKERNDIAAGKGDEELIKLVDMNITPSGKFLLSSSRETFIQSIGSRGFIKVDDIFKPSKRNDYLKKILAEAIELARNDVGCDFALPADYFRAAIEKDNGDVDKTISQLQGGIRDYFSYLLCPTGMETSAGLGERESYLNVYVFPVLVVRKNRDGDRLVQIYILPKDRMGIRPDFEDVTVLGENDSVPRSLEKSDRLKIEISRHISDRIQGGDALLAPLETRHPTRKVVTIDAPAMLGPALKSAVKGNGADNSSFLEPD